MSTLNRHPIVQQAAMGRTSMRWFSDTIGKELTRVRVSLHYTMLEFGNDYLLYKIVEDDYSLLCKYDLVFDSIENMDPSTLKWLKLITEDECDTLKEFAIGLDVESARKARYDKYEELKKEFGDE